MSLPSKREVVAAAEREMAPGVSPRQAVLIGFSAAEGRRLDPFGLVDSATLYRAELLWRDGMRISEAVAAARTERPRWTTRDDRA